MILYSAIRFRARRQHEGSLPRQSQYHLPMEITYTVIPIVIVFILFAFTVVVENQVTALPTVSPDNTINVQAYQWGWRFSYPGFTIVTQTTTGVDDKNVMEMPQGQNVRIVLTSTDVLHGF